MTSSTDIEAMIDRIRAKQTPEQKAEFLRKRLESAARIEEAARKRRTCHECGVDLRHGSHTFRCYYRGW